MIAIATTPLKDNPIKARRIIIIFQLSMKEQMIVKIDAINKDADIINFRPIISDITPVNKVPIAIVAVVADKDKLLCEAVKQNCLENIGKIDCTQYKIEKLENPPKKRHKIISLNFFVFFWIYVFFSTIF